MCEYCGCQSVTVIAELTAEHDRVVTMIGLARAAISRGDPDGAATTAREIAAVLEPHTYVEERGLFPALADAFPEHVAALLVEHRRIEAVLAEAGDTTPGDPSWPARLVEALHLLREHILKEQDGVFPAALIDLGPDDWDRIEAVRAEYLGGECSLTVGHYSDKVTNKVRFGNDPPVAGSFDPGSQRGCTDPAQGPGPDGRRPDRGTGPDPTVLHPR